jgi:hypothetical protein
MLLGEDASYERSLLELLRLAKVGDIMNSVVCTISRDLLSADDEHQDWRGARILDRDHGCRFVAASHDAPRRVVAASDISFGSSKSFDEGKELETYHGGGGVSSLRWLYSNPYVFTTRIMAKIGVLSLSPACIRVFSNYAISRQLAPPASAIWFWPWLRGVIQVDASTVYSRHRVSADQTQNKLREPDWLVQPDPILLLAASMSFGYLLSSYHQLNVEDRYQDRLLSVTFWTSMALGLLYGHSFSATILTVVSWNVLISLVASDAFHTGMKLRTRHRAHISDDVERQ